MQHRRVSRVSGSAWTHKQLRRPAMRDAKAIAKTTDARLNAVALSSFVLLVVVLITSLRGAVAPV